MSAPHLSGSQRPAPGAALRAGSSQAFAARLARVSVLVVDDEPGMRNFMARILGPQCRRIELAASIQEAGEWLAVEPFDVIVLDNLLGNERGLDWLVAQREKGIVPPVILISAFADLEVAIEAMQAGVVDLILKPFRSNQLLNAVARLAEQTRLQSENQLLRHELRRGSEMTPGPVGLTGHSPAITAIRETIARVAPLPSSVLLTGPSGSGKEVAARLIHAMSDRRDNPFVPVNSATLSEDMVEAELFGDVSGERRGLFLHAQGGTLFLDEISELPHAIQTRLLRVLEDRRIRPVGAERELPVDLRLICATNADPAALVAEGRLREDLWHRINILHLPMPPLSARGEDVIELARHFMEALSGRLGMPPVEITPEIAAGLMAQPWPGNVRELRNLIERALILGHFAPDLIQSRDD
ncbi:sigma-54-dependent transcriptional regulator [Pseudogemmobacter hezensis]|uniref:sigma-54-dependent transcriptional regulator n=1 Tax=Pseudogemmobacter hezensis TaxID=2737662 RepID=UPI0020A69C94|nr:sigma-54 dependent transcriptional regulator [Pseudogemmobacter hezensis]